MAQAVNLIPLLNDLIDKVNIIVRNTVPLCYYIYAFNTKDYGIYVGQTNRLPLRITEHCMGKTSADTDFKDNIRDLFLLEVYPTKEEANKRETSLMKELNPDLYKKQHSGGFHLRSKDIYKKLNNKRS